jgi:transcriptional regulator with XRE-family HTH domain
MKLKELRKEKGLTQVELSDKLKLGRVNYCRYEQGQIEPDLQTLIKLADYFNVSLDYLCERKWNDNIGFIPQDRKELVSLILSLDSEQIKDITQMVKGYLFARDKISTGILDN